MTSEVYISVDLIKNKRQTTSKLVLNKFRTSQTDFQNSKLSISGDKTVTPEEFSLGLNNKKIKPILNNLINASSYSVRFLSSVVKNNEVLVSVNITDKINNQDNYTGIVSIDINAFKITENRPLITEIGNLIDNLVTVKNDILKKMKNVQNNNTQIENYLRELDNLLEDAKNIKNNPNSELDNLRKLIKKLEQKIIKTQKDLNNFDVESINSKEELIKLIDLAKTTQFKLDQFDIKLFINTQPIQNVKSEMKQSINAAELVRDDIGAKLDKINETIIVLSNAIDNANKIISALNTEEYNQKVILRDLIVESKLIEEKISKIIDGDTDMQNALKTKNDLKILIDEGQKVINRHNSTMTEIKDCIEKIKKSKQLAQVVLDSLLEKLNTLKTEMRNTTLTADEIKLKLLKIIGKQANNQEVVKAKTELINIIEKSKSISAIELYSFIFIKQLIQKIKDSILEGEAAIKSVEDEKNKYKVELKSLIDKTKESKVKLEKVTSNELFGLDITDTKNKLNMVLENSDNTLKDDNSLLEKIEKAIQSLKDIIQEINNIFDFINSNIEEIRKILLTTINESKDIKIQLEKIKGELALERDVKEGIETLNKEITSSQNIHNNQNSLIDVLKKCIIDLKNINSKYKEVLRQIIDKIKLEKQKLEQKIADVRSIESKLLNVRGKQAERKDVIEILNELKTALEAANQNLNKSDNLIYENTKKNIELLSLLEEKAKNILQSLNEEKVPAIKQLKDNKTQADKWLLTSNPTFNSYASDPYNGFYIIECIEYLNKTIKTAEEILDNNNSSIEEINEANNALKYAINLTEYYNNSKGSYFKPDKIIEIIKNNKAKLDSLKEKNISKIPEFTDIYNNLTATIDKVEKTNSSNQTEYIDAFKELYKANDEANLLINACEHKIKTDLDRLKDEIMLARKNRIIYTKIYKNPNDNYRFDGICFMLDNALKYAQNSLKNSKSNRIEILRAIARLSRANIHADSANWMSRHGWFQRRREFRPDSIYETAKNFIKKLSEKIKMGNDKDNNMLIAKLELEAEINKLSIPLDEYKKNKKWEDIIEPLEKVIEKGLIVLKFIE
ncbi:hypothetical protein KQ873_03300 [Mycoplasma zalophidermidis]|uniref:hypothetical protein n=1 Tax=Mycoplasma zalophidermidis TaxID=398174 RepID=UPI001C0FD42C|nr:hypothetical protein [Mycoplasma zalophidermidis]MBU4690048.1 hypothetical protein [Mycoplasma zalophidermidis]